MFHSAAVALVLVACLCWRPVSAQCDDEGSLYPFGSPVNDRSIIGDDGPPGILSTLATSKNTFFRFYGADYTKIYFNPNGQISLGNISNPKEDNSMSDFFPSPAARPEPPFLTAFWNDFFLNGNPGILYYGQHSSGPVLQRAASDIAVKNKNIYPTNVIIATWYNASSFDNIREHALNTSAETKIVTVQVVMVMDNSGLSFTIFNYHTVGWYLAHSMPAVAMLNQGRQSSRAVNLFASGSSLMLDLGSTCANAGVYGRFVMQTNLENVKILDQPNWDVMNRCYLEQSSLYPYGPNVSDSAITQGDDGPSARIRLDQAIYFYGKKFNDIYININGPISFNAPFFRYLPTRNAIDEPAFMAAFWNDISLSMTAYGIIHYRVTTNIDLLRRFQIDVTAIGATISNSELSQWKLMIATWSRVQFFGATEDDPQNTFQVVFGFSSTRSYALFLYSYIGWYQNRNGYFAVATFNQGGSSGVNVEVGPPPGPEWFFSLRRGNSVNRPGMFVYETHTPLIYKRSQMCVCKVNKKKWVTTYDGSKHPLVYEKKLRLSRYLKHDDPCKFQVMVFSQLTLTGDYVVLWVSISFGIHSNVTKFDKNIAMERVGPGSLEIRGRGYQGAQPITLPFQWTSADGRTSIQMVGDSNIGYIVNSTTCPFRLHYAPNCPDPVVTFTINKAAYSNSHLIGMCQDCNGNPDDDWRPCSNDPVYDWTFWERNIDIAASCIDEEEE